jgi:mono/diheme cytochrome c family protein
LIQIERPPHWLIAGVLLLTSTQQVIAASSGQALFSRCAACHLADGQGVPGLFPPLADRLGTLMSKAGARDYVVLVVQMGLTGELQIDGSPYQGVMPAQGPDLGNEGVAAVLNYVFKQLNRKSLPAGWTEFSGAEVARIIARHQDESSVQRLTLRSSLFGARSP